ncbi:MAG TPA: DUF3072 domain-containing protein [Armatimonadota bacterium]|nr:DUF3072 domain-containing protein [Armatimonadota bacterium]
MIERNGKNFCLYAGLLDEAHQQGLTEIRTTLLQIPADENGNVAICQSEVRTERGVFTGLGDASAQNVTRAMQTCLIRMAETRSKARALRDAVNVGVVALEELPPESEETSTVARSGMTRQREQNGRSSASRIAPIAPAESKTHAESAPFESGQAVGTDPMTPAQRRMLESLARQAGESIEMDELSRRQASQLITELKGRIGQPRAA